MDPTSFHAFMDELQKIATAGDLMSPAVVSDSATVDGPPATAFPPSRKPLKKRATITKEAIDFEGVKKRTRQFFVRGHQVAKKLDQKANNALISGYVKLPTTAQNIVTGAVSSDPSDQMAGAVVGGIGRKLIGH